MKRIHLLLLFFIMSAGFTQAQRYLTPIFDSVNKSTVIYGENYTILSLAVTGHTSRQPLVMDVYTPDGDTETQRPLIIYWHTGIFLPNPQNGFTTGTRTDSCAVEMATRLAKMGYVVAVPDYRLGWNPTSSDNDVLKGGLINAAYRGIQDARNCIRYFRHTIATEANPYGICDEKITMWGEGTGGYITLGAATLDNFNQDILLPGKFFTAAGFPMVLEAINGNIDGTSLGVSPGAPLPYPAGDTLCIPNYPEYASDFALCVNMGGALGDTIWLDASDGPFISYHVPTDDAAPYYYGILTVPGFGYQIVDVAGSYKVQQQAAAQGNNAAIVAAGISDAWTTAAQAAQAIAPAPYNTYFEGMSSFNRPCWPHPFNPGEFKCETGPWSWWDQAYWSQIPHPNCGGVNPPDCSFHVINSIGNNDMSASKSRSYIDSIIGYYAPRAFAVMNLGVSTCGVATEELLNDKTIKVAVVPNPAADYTFIQTEADNAFETVQLFDMNGRMIREYRNVNNNTLIIYRDGLPAGIYTAKIGFDKGVIAKQIIFE